jgi:hypothetical protein
MFAVATGFVDLRVRAYPDRAYEVYTPAVLEGNYGAPADYRVLAPFADEALRRLTGWTRATTWHVSRLAWILAAYLAFHVYLRTWYTPPYALLGTALVAATLPLTFTNSWAHPDHIPELALFTLGCLAIARRQEALVAVSLTLAVLNRETGLFLILLYLVSTPWSRTHLIRSALVGSLGTAIFVSLRLVRGFESYDYWQLARNVEFLKLIPPPRDPYYRSLAYFWLVVFAPLMALAFYRARSKPAFQRRALFVVPCFVLVAITISSIIETRIFTPLYPLILPAAVGTLAADSSPDPKPEDQS